LGEVPLIYEPGKTFFKFEVNPPFPNAKIHTIYFDVETKLPKWGTTKDGPLISTLSITSMTFSEDSFFKVCSPK